VNVLILLIIFVLSATVHQPLYFIIPAVSLTYIAVNKSYKIEINKFTKLYISLICFIILFFCIQIIINSELPIYSLKGVFRYISYVSFALFVIVLDKSVILNFFKYLTYILVAMSPLALYQLGALDRYQGIFNHANHLAYVQVICIYFLIRYKPFVKSWNFLLIGLLFFSLLLTKTSGAFIILFLIAVYNFFILKQLSFKKKFVIVGVLALITPVFLIYSEKLVSQIDTLEYLEWKFLLPRIKDFRPGGYGSFVWRILYWLKIYFAFINEAISNILFGVGIDALTKGNMPYIFMNKDPHNDFIKVLIEFGAVGLVLFINFLRNAFIMLKRNVNLMIILIVPLLFDNAIVNFSFITTLTLIFAYEYKTNTEKAD
jgi:O-antigen ligase